MVTNKIHSTKRNKGGQMAGAVSPRLDRKLCVKNKRKSG